MESSLLKAVFIFAAAAAFLLLNGNLRQGIKELTRSRREKKERFSR